MAEYSKPPQTEGRPKNSLTEKFNADPVIAQLNKLKYKANLNDPKREELIQAIDEQGIDFNIIEAVKEHCGIPALLNAVTGEKYLKAAKLAHPNEDIAREVNYAKDKLDLLSGYSEGFIKAEIAARGDKTWLTKKSDSDPLIKDSGLIRLTKYFRLRVIKIKELYDQSEKADRDDKTLLPKQYMKNYEERVAWKKRELGKLIDFAFKRGPEILDDTGIIKTLQDAKRDSIFAEVEKQKTPHFASCVIRHDIDRDFLKHQKEIRNLKDGETFTSPDTKRLYTVAVGSHHERTYYFNSSPKDANRKIWGRLDSNSFFILDKGVYTETTLHEVQPRLSQRPVQFLVGLDGKTVYYTSGQQVPKIENPFARAGDQSERFRIVGARAAENITLIRNANRGEPGTLYLHDGTFERDAHSIKLVSVRIISLTLPQMFTS